MDIIIIGSIKRLLIHSQRHRNGSIKKYMIEWSTKISVFFFISNVSKSLFSLFYQNKIIWTESYQTLINSLMNVILPSTISYVLAWHLSWTGTHVQCVAVNEWYTEINLILRNYIPRKLGKEFGSEYKDRNVIQIMWDIEKNVRGKGIRKTKYLTLALPVFYRFSKKTNR